MKNPLDEKSLINYFEEKFEFKIQTLDFRFPVETLDELLKNFYKDYEHSSFLLHADTLIDEVVLKKTNKSYLLSIPLKSKSNEQLYIGISDLLSFLILFDEPGNQSINQEKSRFFLTFEPTVIKSIFDYFYNSGIDSLSVKERKLLLKLKNIQKNQLDPYYINKFQQALLVGALNENNKIKHEKITEAISFTDELILITDLAGNIKDSNKNFKDIFEFVPNNIKSIFPKEFLEKAFKDSISAGEYKEELELKIKNKESLMIVSMYLAKDDLSRPNGYVLTFKDVSDLRKLDRLNKKLIARLRQNNVELTEVNKRLLEADKIKIDLLSVVSHELKTPLSTILGFSELITQREYDSETVKSFAGKILESAGSLDKLISDYLEVASNSFGISSNKLQTIPINLKQLIEECYQQEAKNFKGSFTFEINSLGYDPVIFSEIQNLKRLFSNLINNSMKFSPNAGKISVKILNDGENLTISISDEGIGLSVEQASRVFEPFYRADNSDTREFNGIGLGLSICKKTVELYGGSIWCEPGTDAGTTFYVTLPVNPHVKSLNLSETDAKETQSADFDNTIV